VLGVPVRKAVIQWWSNIAVLVETAVRSTICNCVALTPTRDLWLRDTLFSDVMRTATTSPSLLPRRQVRR
jgi:hypothetical protein